jgi:hypothetical protein
MDLLLIGAVLAAIAVVGAVAFLYIRKRKG